MLDPISAELKRLNAHIAELEAENARLREACKELLEDFSNKHRACVVKTHDVIDSHEWDAWLHKATAYADCEKSLRAVLQTAGPIPQPTESE
jgi:seryl-tRNA synthetase